MIRFMTDIIGSEIVLFQEHASLGPVGELIFAPENGAVLGFYCFDPIANRKRVIMANEVKRISGGQVLVAGYDSLADPADLVRITEALEVGAKILKETVVTESGQKLGRVGNATVDTISWKLSRLYVEPQLGLKLFARELLIPAAKIIRIEKKQIIVSDEYAKVKSTSPAVVPSPILE